MAAAPQVLLLILSTAVSPLWLFSLHRPLNTRFFWSPSSPQASGPSNPPPLVGSGHATRYGVQKVEMLQSSSPCLPILLSPLFLLPMLTWGRRSRYEPSEKCTGKMLKCSQVSLWKATPMGAVEGGKKLFTVGELMPLTTGWDPGGMALTCPVPLCCHLLSPEERAFCCTGANSSPGLLLGAVIFGWKVLQLTDTWFFSSSLPFLSLYTAY